MIMMNEEDTGHSATDDQSRLSAQSFYSLQWENGRKEAASSVSSTYVSVLWEPEGL